MRENVADATRRAVKGTKQLLRIFIQKRKPDSRADPQPEPSPNLESVAESSAMNENIARVPKEGALCDRCLSIFEGEKDDGLFYTLFAEDQINDMAPNHCRVCSLLFSRMRCGCTEHLKTVSYYLHHERSPKQGELDETAISLIKDEHSTDQEPDEIADSKPSNLFLGLELIYKDEERITLQLGALPQGYHIETATDILSSSTSSLGTLLFVKDKLEECRNTHEFCSRHRQTRDTRWHPRRLLQIQNVSGTPTVQLREGDIPESEPYVSLSHCWGRLRPMRLTKDTKSCLRSGVTVTELPRTFREAVDFSRALGIHYIWIDSLCIFQDDTDDWDTEAAAMQHVYSNAVLNLAATDSINGSMGLFRGRHPTLECPLLVDLDVAVTYQWFEPDVTATQTTSTSHRRRQRYPCTGVYQLFPIDQWDLNVEHGPLNRRAWVMQERFLSPRVAHFTATQVVWECLQDFSSELFPQGLPEIARRRIPPRSPSLVKRAYYQLADSTMERNRDFKRAWKGFVCAYSMCGLSVPGDKLVAIKGIADLVEEATGDELVAGLWRSNLFQQLCWTSLPNCRPRGNKDRPSDGRMQWRAPSWSWAATDVEVCGWNIDSHLHCENFKTRAAIVGEVAYEASPAGKLKKASLELQGKLLPATYLLHCDCPAQHDDAQSIQKTSELSFKYGGSTARGRYHYTQAVLISLDNPAEPPQGDVVCLAMYSCVCESCYGMYRDSSAKSLEALALRPHPTLKGHYERLGIIMLKGQAVDVYLENEPADEENIVLV